MDKAAIRPPLSPCWRFPVCQLLYSVLDGKLQELEEKAKEALLLRFTPHEIRQAARKMFRMRNISFNVTAPHPVNSVAKSSCPPSSSPALLTVFDRAFYSLGLQHAWQGMEEPGLSQLADGRSSLLFKLFIRHEAKTLESDYF
ncbi:hypothetical protein VRRI112168_12850 [Vreelandella rituensis]|uniref:Uncharacterized protein n=1 Tax=Vreelandella rituensis TaxID=2282306 RepID=A0A368TYL7_9GAMM|nr:hypothetical protein [Halomonas rituensis]RCV89959.1 hypothetical protein DU506_12140 [Halomonas rituensis]